jgi:hypothetical protein
MGSLFLEWMSFFSHYIIYHLLQYFIDGHHRRKIFHPPSIKPIWFWLVQVRH